MLIEVMVYQVILCTLKYACAYLHNIEIVYHVNTTSYNHVKGVPPEEAAPPSAVVEPPPSEACATEPRNASSTQERLKLAEEAGLQIPDALTSGEDIDVKAILAKASQETGKSEKALREAFKRSLPAYSDPRTESTHVRKDKVRKMPCLVADKMMGKADYDFWLGVWLESGREYVDCKSTVVDKEQEIDDAGITRAWLNEEQMLWVFKSAMMVSAYKKELSKKDSLHREHPEIPWCQEAHQYSCVVDDSNRESIKKILSKSTSASVNIDAGDAEKLMRRGRQRAPAGSSSGAPCAATAVPVKLPETADEKAAKDKAELLEKAAKAAETAKARAEAAKDPKIQKGKWLTGVASLISKLKEKAATAKSADAIPNGMSKLYETTFNDGVATLRALREFLEKPKIGAPILKTKLKEANGVVTGLKADMDAFDGLYRTYGKKD